MNNAYIVVVLIVTPLACVCRMNMNPAGHAGVESAPIVRRATEGAEEKGNPAVLFPKDELGNVETTAEKSSTGSKRLNELMKLSIRESVFEYPHPAELDRFEQLLVATLEKNISAEKLNLRWSDEGWNLERWNSGARECFALREADGQLRGRGFFAFQTGHQSNLVLQAPHRFFDLGSGTIVRKMFQESDCFAAAWNTVHRKQFDLAHQDDHFINAFTRAVLKVNADAAIVQIHGFNSDKLSGLGSTAKVIVSDSTIYPGRIARSTAANLKQTFGQNNVRLFPIEVDQLGGTQNAQANVVLNAGSASFLHLEINQSFRKDLKTTRKKRQQFVDSLAIPQ
jgi:hypothetical protein